MAFYIKQNDTSPALQATLKDSNDTAIDLSNSSVQFHMRKIGSTTAKIDRAATISDADNGTVYYSWQSGDTDTIGSFEAEFQVTFAGGEIETFPNNRYIQIEITNEIS